MEEIEYLEEYEDLVLPAINSAADAAVTAKSSKSVNVDNDESSSSLDQDIFNCLFDDNSDDDNEEQQQPLKKEQEARTQKIVETRPSLDESHDLLNDLDEQVAKELSLEKHTSTITKEEQLKAPRQGTIVSKKSVTKPKLPSTISSLSSVKTKTVATVKPTVQQKSLLQKANIVKQKARYTNATASSGSLKTETSNPSPSTSFSARRHLVGSTSIVTPTSSSATNKSIASHRPKPSFIKQRPATIVKPEKIVTKDPTEDPLNLDDLSSAESANYSVSDISGETYNSISDFDDDDYDFASHIDALDDDDDDDDDDDSSNSQVIDISNDSSESRFQFDDLRGSTPSPVVSEDRELANTSALVRHTLPKFMANHEIIKSLLTKGEKPKLLQLINKHDKANNSDSKSQDLDDLELCSTTETTNKDLTINAPETDESVLSESNNGENAHLKSTTSESCLLKANVEEEKIKGEIQSPVSVTYGAQLKDVSLVKNSIHDSLHNQAVGAEMEIGNEELIEGALKRGDEKQKDSKPVEQTRAQTSKLEKNNQSTKDENTSLQHIEESPEEIQTLIRIDKESTESTSIRPRKKRFRNLNTPEVVLDLKEDDKSLQIIGDNKCDEPILQSENAVITKTQEGGNYVPTVLPDDCKTKTKAEQTVTTTDITAKEPFKSPTKSVEKSNKNISNRDRSCDSSTESSRETLNKHITDVPRGVIMNPFVQRTAKNTVFKDGGTKISRDSSRDNSRESSVESSRSTSKDRHKDNNTSKLVRSEFTTNKIHTSKPNDLKEVIIKSSRDNSRESSVESSRSSSKDRYKDNKTSKLVRSEITTNKQDASKHNVLTDVIKKSSTDNSRESSVESSRSTSKDRHKDNKTSKLVRSEITTNKQHASKQNVLRDVIKKTEVSEKQAPVDTKNRETPKMISDLAEKKSDNKMKPDDKDITKNKTIANKDIKQDSKNTTQLAEAKPKETTKKSFDVEEKKSDIDVKKSFAPTPKKITSSTTKKEEGTTEKTSADKPLKSNESISGPSNFNEAKQSSSPYKQHKEPVKSDIASDLQSKTDKVDREGNKSKDVTAKIQKQTASLKVEISMSKISRDIIDSSRAGGKSKAQTDSNKTAQHSRPSAGVPSGSVKKHLTLTKEASVDVGKDNAPNQKTVKISSEKPSVAIKSDVAKGLCTSKTANNTSVMESANISLTTGTSEVKVLECEKKVLKEPKAIIRHEETPKSSSKKQHESPLHSHDYKHIKSKEMCAKASKPKVLTSTNIVTDTNPEAKSVNSKTSVSTTKLPDSKTKHTECDVKTKPCVAAESSTQKRATKLVDEKKHIRTVPTSLAKRSSKDPSIKSVASNCNVSKESECPISGKTDVPKHGMDDSKSSKNKSTSFAEPEYSANITKSKNKEHPDSKVKKCELIAEEKNDVHIEVQTASNSSKYSTALADACMESTAKEIKVRDTSSTLIINSNELEPQNPREISSKTRDLESNIISCKEIKETETSVKDSEVSKNKNVEKMSFTETDPKISKTIKPITVELIGPEEPNDEQRDNSDKNNDLTLTTSKEDVSAKTGGVQVEIGAKEVKSQINVSQTSTNLQDATNSRCVENLTETDARKKQDIKDVRMSEEESTTENEQKQTINDTSREKLLRDDEPSEDKISTVEENVNIFPAEGSAFQNPEEIDGHMLTKSPGAPIRKTRSSKSEDAVIPVETNVSCNPVQALETKDVVIKNTQANIRKSKNTKSAATTKIPESETNVETVKSDDKNIQENVNKPSEEKKNIKPESTSPSKRSSKDQSIKSETSNSDVSKEKDAKQLADDDGNSRELNKSSKHKSTNDEGPQCSADTTNKSFSEQIKNTENSDSKVEKCELTAEKEIPRSTFKNSKALQGSDQESTHKKIKSHGGSGDTERLKNEKSTSIMSCNELKTQNPIELSSIKDLGSKLSSETLEATSLNDNKITDADKVTQISLEIIGPNESNDGKRDVRNYQNDEITITTGKEKASAKSDIIEQQVKFGTIEFKSQRITPETSSIIRTIKPNTEDVTKTISESAACKKSETNPDMKDVCGSEEQSAAVDSRNPGATFKEEFLCKETTSAESNASVEKNINTFPAIASTLQNREDIDEQAHSNSPAPSSVRKTRSSKPEDVIQVETNVSSNPLKALDTKEVVMKNTQANIGKSKNTKSEESDLSNKDHLELRNIVHEESKKLDVETEKLCEVEPSAIDKNCDQKIATTSSTIMRKTRSTANIDGDSTNVSNNMDDTNLLLTKNLKTSESTIKTPQRNIRKNRNTPSKCEDLGDDSKSQESIETKSKTVALDEVNQADALLSNDKNNANKSPHRKNRKTRGTCDPKADIHDDYDIACKDEIPQSKSNVLKKSDTQMLVVDSDKTSITNVQETSVKTDACTQNDTPKTTDEELKSTEAIINETMSKGSQNIKDVVNKNDCDSITKSEQPFAIEGDLTTDTEVVEKNAPAIKILKTAVSKTGRLPVSTTCSESLETLTLSKCLNNAETDLCKDLTSNSFERSRLLRRRGAESPVCENRDGVDKTVFKTPTSVCESSNAEAPSDQEVKMKRRLRSPAMEKEPLAALSKRSKIDIRKVRSRNIDVCILDASESSSDPSAEELTNTAKSQKQSAHNYEHLTGSAVQAHDTKSNISKPSKLEKTLEEPLCMDSGSTDKSSQLTSTFIDGDTLSCPNSKCTKGKSNLDISDSKDRKQLPGMSKKSPDNANLNPEKRTGGSILSFAEWLRGNNRNDASQLQNQSIASTPNAQTQLSDTNNVIGLQELTSKTPIDTMSEQHGLRQVSPRRGRKVKTGLISKGEDDGNNSEISKEKEQKEAASHDVEAEKSECPPNIAAPQNVNDTKLETTTAQEKGNAYLKAPPQPNTPLSGTIIDAAKIGGDINDNANLSQTINSASVKTGKRRSKIKSGRVVVAETINKDQQKIKTTQPTRQDKKLNKRSEIDILIESMSKEMKDAGIKDLLNTSSNVKRQRAVARRSNLAESIYFNPTTFLINEPASKEKLVTDAATISESAGPAHTAEETSKKSPPKRSLSKKCINTKETNKTITSTTETSRAMEMEKALIDEVEIRNMNTTLLDPLKYEATRQHRPSSKLASKTQPCHQSSAFKFPKPLATLNSIKSAEDIPQMCRGKANTNVNDSVKRVRPLKCRKLKVKLNRHVVKKYLQNLMDKTQKHKFKGPVTATATTIRAKSVLPTSIEATMSKQPACGSRTNLLEVKKLSQGPILHTINKDPGEVYKKQQSLTTPKTIATIASAGGSNNILYTTPVNLARDKGRNVEEILANSVMEPMAPIELKNEFLDENPNSLADNTLPDTPTLIARSHTITQAAANALSNTIMPTDIRLMTNDPMSTRAYVPSFGVTPTLVDANGARMYTFLHPAKYSRNHGNVLLDYCCPNLDGPMPAIDPTRIHAQVQTPVIELPSCIVLTTKVVTRAELESQSTTIPTVIRKKAEKLRSNIHQKGAVPHETEINPLSSQSSLPPHLLPPQITNSTPAQEPQALKSVMPVLKPSKFSTPPQFSPAINALAKYLPSTTTITAKIGPPFSQPPLALPISNSNKNVSSAVSVVAKGSPFLNEAQANLLRSNLRRVDVIFKSLVQPFENLNFTERHRIIDNLVASGKFMPKDLERTIVLMEDYLKQINCIQRNQITDATSTSNIVNALPPQLASAASMRMPPLQPAPSHATSTFKAGAAQSLEQVHNTELRKVQSTVKQQNTTVSTAAMKQRQVPIYDTERNIIGYQLQVITPTTTTMPAHTKSDLSTTSTGIVASSSLAASSNNRRKSLKRPAQDSPRVFYTSQPLQTSTPKANLNAMKYSATPLNVAQNAQTIGKSQNGSIVTTMRSAGPKSAGTETITTTTTATVKRVTRSRAAGSKIIIVSKSNSNEETILPDVNHPTEIKHEKDVDDFIG